MSSDSPPRCRVAQSCKACKRSNATLLRITLFLITLARILHRLSTLPGFTLVVLLLTAGSAAADGLVLKKDVELKGSPAAGKAGPLFLTADKIESTAPDVIEASGKVAARQAGQNFFADWLRYDTTQNRVEARGRVRLEQPALLVDGDALELDLDAYSGELAQPVYHLVAQHGRGDASQNNNNNKKHNKQQKATNTTCPVDNDDWFLEVDDLDIDKSRNVGTARNASLHILGETILYSPLMDLPRIDVRKSGVLALTFGTTQRCGVDFLVHYYLNLAPYYVATLY